MSEADEVEVPADSGAGDHGRQPAGLSRWGVASLLLAVLSLVAVALIAVIWSDHRAAAAERTAQARAMQAAAEWTGLLINMNADNVEAAMAQLRDGTVGELNTGFEASIAPYRDVVKTLRSSTTGQVESVSIEVVHHDLQAGGGDAQARGGNPKAPPGGRPPAPPALPADLAARTDTVLVVATSVSENAGTQSAPAPGGTPGPTTVRWNLRLGVSEVDGKPMISRLESLR